MSVNHRRTNRMSRSWTSAITSSGVSGAAVAVMRKANVTCSPGVAPAAHYPRWREGPPVDRGAADPRLVRLVGGEARGRHLELRRLLGRVDSSSDPLRPGRRKDPGRQRPRPRVRLRSGRLWMLGGAGQELPAGQRLALDPGV